MLAILHVFACFAAPDTPLCLQIRHMFLSLFSPYFLYLFSLVVILLPSILALVILFMKRDVVILRC